MTSQSSSLTIGNFDGCHIGHVKLIASALELAVATHSCPTVLSFDPHPREYFTQRLPRLFTSTQKARALAELGVELLVVQHFDAEFSALTPEAFCYGLLQKQLLTQALSVGYDFRFGSKRSGGLTELRQYLPGVQIRELGEIQWQGEVASSTRIRQALESGELARANELLGRPYLIEGQIQTGRRLGRQLGFPTANLKLSEQLAPKTGVYCGFAALQAGCPIFGKPESLVPAVLNIGYRPTVENGEAELLLEVHLLSGDYGPDSLYGQNLGIYLCDYLRPEQKFPSLDALKAQIAADSEKARRLLQNQSWS